MDNSSKSERLERTSSGGGPTDKPSESDLKRARFRNLIQLIRLTTSILNKGKGPKLYSKVPVPDPYTNGGPYTYLDAVARLLVRKDEVIAAVECASFRPGSNEETVELAVMQSHNVPVPEAIKQSDGQSTPYRDAIMTSDDVWDDKTPPSLARMGELPGTYITNPDSSFLFDNISEDKPQLLYQSSERSEVTLWNSIKKNAWHYLLMTPRAGMRKVAPRVELLRHLATIESYLEDYRALRSGIDSNSDVNKAARQANRDRFQKYILTSCWVKMHTRAEHWISIGIITSICNTSQFSVSTAATAADFEEDNVVQVDQDLFTFLRGGLGPESRYIEDIMEYYVYHMRGRSSNPSSSNLESLQVLVNAEIWNHNENGNCYLYTPDIAAAFHRLLIASLLSYVFRLRIVDEAVRALPDVPDSAIPPPIEAAFVQLLLSAQLLFFLSHSRILKNHLKLLKSVLTIPTEAQAGMYTESFVKFELWHDDQAYDKDLIRRIEALPVTVRGPPQPRPVEVAGEEVLDRAQPVSDPQTEVETVYRRWIMGLVDHFASIRVLERVSGRLPPEAKINFSILGLNRPSLTAGNWEAMVEEIQTVCKDSSLTSRVSQKPLPPDFANKAIMTLETKIRGYKAPKSVNKTSARFEATVYSSFQSLLSKPSMLRDFSGCGHCEAILMAIIHRISNKNDLDFSLKLHSSRTFKIAVSKSCCPVCWDIVNVFNQKQTTQEQRSESGNNMPPVRFQARGRHPNLYPVDLPDVLDDGIKDELLEKFSLILLEGLVSLLDEDAKAAKAKHAHSESSVSQAESVAFSIGSSLGGSVDIGPSQTNQKYLAGDRQNSLDRVMAWMNSSCNSEQPEL